MDINEKNWNKISNTEVLKYAKKYPNAFSQVETEIKKGETTSGYLQTPSCTGWRARWVGNLCIKLKIQSSLSGLDDYVEFSHIL